VTVESENEDNECVGFYGIMEGGDVQLMDPHQLGNILLAGLP
jgi:hypothetical protein